MSQLFETDPIRRSALIKDDYRYLLERYWGERNLVLFVMLNPSTADGTKDDPTIRRCIGFAKSNGFLGLRVVNLYAWRATEPQEIFKAADPIGPENDKWIDQAAFTCDTIVAAWGTLGQPERVHHVMRILEAHKLVYCLGRTKDGHPRHPLGVNSKRKLERFSLEGGA